ncbi:hypothetical protein N0O92_21695 [Alkalihalobacillus sp. MEB130]|uniref:DUF6414 family protein n=1 Tax=Alkalihalobacillus sp. MEB130 TaxID=2976704 RepID=UPI0028DF23AD|nr:hypothetical protein [Alkalihalobacillus sp. MEB130]MDT8862795.1 hypothetical protein [Alkalihalobacillus sp. MEB130]
MFKNLIYFDASKVAEYKAILEGKKHVAIKNVKVSSGKSLSANVSVLSGDISGKNEMEGELLENLILDCNEFEGLLESKGNDNYFDLIENDFETETIPRTGIIRFEGGFRIPEEFDMMDLINDFKPMLTSSMNLDNPQEEEIFTKLFAKESTKIPVFFECNDFIERVGFAKLNSNNLCYELEHLEDFENEEVTVIAKVLSRKNVTDKPIIVFDIMKDLFSLSRGIRRQMGEQEIEGMQSIQSDKNILVLEVLAIYQ